MLGGEELLAWLVLALGGAMAVGNTAALIRPPAARRNPEDLPRAPKVRSVVFAVVGLLAALWGVATLATG